MGPLGLQEILVIFVVVLIVFGPKKLPEIGKNLGKTISYFRRASSDLQNTLRQEMRVEGLKDANLSSIIEGLAGRPGAPVAPQAGNVYPGPPAGVGPPPDRGAGPGGGTAG